MKNAIYSAMAAASVLLLEPSAQAQTVWNMPTNYADQQFQTANNRWFAKEVETRTDGRLKINIHSNASLYKMAEILQAVRSGQVAAGETFRPEHGRADG